MFTILWRVNCFDQGKKKLTRKKAAEKSQARQKKPELKNLASKKQDGNPAESLAPNCLAPCTMDKTTAFPAYSSTPSFPNTSTTKFRPENEIRT